MASPDAGNDRMMDDRMMDDRMMAERVAALTAAFVAVDQEMRGLPVHNPALAVEPVGFRAHDGHFVGVMITPWFMGVLAVHPEAGAWRDRAPADKQVRTFPSGDYEFLVGEVGDGLRYLSLSLFSPMGAFDSQDSARQAAEGALKTLFTPAEAIDRLSAAETSDRIRPLPPEIARRNREAARRK